MHYVGKIEKLTTMKLNIKTNKNMSFLQRLANSLLSQMTKVSSKALQQQTHVAKERSAQQVKKFYENNLREKSQQLVDHGKKLPSELGVIFNNNIVLIYLIVYTSKPI